ncbi:hypothetical protein PC123_g22595 [Phytophthora cactorum]|nr:hypothetical protein PC123_g22595 [Phytophthora cactorum]
MGTARVVPTPRTVPLPSTEEMKPRLPPLHEKAWLPRAMTTLRRHRRVDETRQLAQTTQSTTRQSTFMGIAVTSSGTFDTTLTAALKLTNEDDGGPGVKDTEEGGALRAESPSSPPPPNTATTDA